MFGSRFMSIWSLNPVGQIMAGGEFGIISGSGEGRWLKCGGAFRGCSNSQTALRSAAAGLNQTWILFNTANKEQQLCFWSHWGATGTRPVRPLRHGATGAEENLFFCSPTMHHLCGLSVFSRRRVSSSSGCDCKRWRLLTSFFCLSWSRDQNRGREETWFGHRKLKVTSGLEGLLPDLKSLSLWLVETSRKLVPEQVVFFLLVVGVIRWLRITWSGSRGTFSASFLLRCWGIFMSVLNSGDGFASVSSSGILWTRRGSSRWRASFLLTSFWEVKSKSFLIPRKKKTQTVVWAQDRRRKLEQLWTSG